MTRALTQILTIALFLLPTGAQAERACTIDGGRILLGQLVPELKDDVAGIDLGPSPRAGSSRLLGTSELNYALRSAGSTREVREPIRVLRAARRWTQKALTDFITPSIGSALPSYAILAHLDVPRSLTTAANVNIGSVILGQLPKRTGTVRTSVVVELMSGGELEQRVSLPMTVQLGERPKPESVERGQQLTLTIDLGHAQISAPAVTLQSSDVGTVVLCRVLRTKKVLRVKLLSKTHGSLVTE